MSFVRALDCVDNRLGITFHTVVEDGRYNTLSNYWNYRKNRDTLPLEYWAKNGSIGLYTYHSYSAPQQLYIHGPPEPVLYVVRSRYVVEYDDEVRETEYRRGSHDSIPSTTGCHYLII